MPRYIDAERFSERFDMMCDAGGVLAPVTKAVREMVKKLIKAEPTVDVQSADVEPVRHGRWIRICGDDYECSECQAAVWSRPPYPIERYKYCWSCGAKMDKEVEE